MDVVLLCRWLFESKAKISVINNNILVFKNDYASSLKIINDTKIVLNYAYISK